MRTTSAATGSPGRLRIRTTAGWPRRIAPARPSSTWTSAQIISGATRVNTASPGLSGD